MKNEELKFYPKHSSDEKTTLTVCEDKRFERIGIASKIGPDIHHKPSIEISDEVGGQCYTFCIFPSDDFYNKVSVGDIVTVRANYLVLSSWYGVVMKYSELVTAEPARNSHI